MNTKDVQGKLWSTSPAKWMKHIEPGFIPMYIEALDHLALDEEKILLDAGCGSGLFLSMASASGALIHGIDAAPGLLALSRQRLPGTQLLLEDLEALPFIDGSFDVVTGFNSFQYAGSFQNALTEARRVVKRHGKVVIGMWSKKEKCEAATVMEAVLSLLPPPPPGTPGVFDLSQEGKIEAMCKAVGLKIISRTEAFCPWQFSSDDDLLDGFLSTAPFVKAVEIAGEETVKETIINSVQPYSMTDGVYYLKNSQVVFITEKI